MTGGTFRRMKLSGKKNILSNFNTSTGRFSEVCSKFRTALSKLQSTCPMCFFNYFLRNFVWSALDLSEEKFGLERVAFLHGYENSNQCFHSNFLRNNLWEHSKLQLIEGCVLIKNQNFPETCWSLWVGFPNLHLTCPVQPIQFFWVDSVFYCFLDSEWK